MIPEHMIPVFPQPLVTTAFPPPLQCGCTWAYSPHTYGTPDKPYVLKIYWGMCRILEHRRKTSAGSVHWTVALRREL